MKLGLLWFARNRRSPPYGFRMTRGGILFVLGSALIGLAAIDANINLLLIIFGFCGGGLLINAFYGWRTLRGLSIRRIVPDAAVCGQSFVIRYVITNPRRWFGGRCILIEDELGPTSLMPNPEAYVLELPCGETMTLTVPSVSFSRGRLAFSTIRLSSRYPFRLFSKWVRHRLDQELIVFPALGKMMADIEPASNAAEASSGGALMGHIKGDDEYYGIREFRDGDNPRRIHWRRSARTGQLMIREMAQVRSRQMWCVLNTWVRADDPAQSHRFEQAVSAAATTLCEALERGTRIGLIYNGNPPVVLPPVLGRACRPRMLRELALCLSHSEDDLATLIRRLTWPARWHGPCLLFGAGREDEMQDAAAALSQHLGPTTIYVPGTPAFDGLFQPTDVLSRPALGDEGAASQLVGMIPARADTEWR